MKLYISIIAALSLFLLNDIHAQSNPLEFEKVAYTSFERSYSYVRYPDMPLGDEYKMITTSKLVLDSVGNKPIVDGWLEKPKVLGFRDVTKEENPDLIAELQIEDIKIQKPVIRTSESTDKNGNLYITNNVEIKYHIKYSSKLFDARKNIVLQQHKNAIDAKKWTREFKYQKNDNMAISGMNNQISDSEETIKKDIENTIKALGAGYTKQWSRMYGTQDYSDMISFYKMNDKKHYESYLYHYEVVGFSSYYTHDLDKILKGSLTQPERFINYNLSLIDKYKNSSQKVKAKIESTSYYNIANAYLWNEQFDKVDTYVNLGLETGEMKKDFDQLLKTRDEHLAYLKKHNIASRQDRK